MSGTTDHLAANFNGATFSSALSTLASGFGRDNDTSGAATEAIIAGGMVVRRRSCSIEENVNIYKIIS